MADEDLMGLTEIAHHFAVTRQLAARWVKAAAFPAPAATLSCGRIWRSRDVLAWADRTGRTQGGGVGQVRPGRPRRTPAPQT